MTDEQQIRDLVARYSDAVCRRDPQAWVANWADDCVWDLGGSRVVEGPDAALALWTSSLVKYPFVAQVPQSGVVTVDGDTATGWWYVLELNHLADGSGTLHLAHYTDAYRRTGSGWRFARRAFHLIYRGPLDRGTVVPL